MRLLSALGFFLSFLLAQAQYVQIGTKSFNSSFYGPITTDTSSSFYSRYAYIYPGQSLGNFGHKDTLTALSFFSQNNDSLRSPCKMKMYLKSTKYADFDSGSIHWLDSMKSMTLVYEGNPSAILGSKPGEKIFAFNQLPYFVFDTTGGHTHLQLFIEYVQQINQTGRIAFSCENGNTVTDFTSFNETKFVRGSSTGGMDSMTTNSNIVKPTLRLYLLRDDYNLEVNSLYALGRVPTLMDMPDTILSSVSNIGKNTVYNYPVYLKVSGSNTFLDSIVLDSLARYETKKLHFITHQPDTLGAEILTVELPADDDNSNNALSKNRLVNYNVYSHTDPFSSNSGGVGFPGSTGDFVSKFYVNGSSYINQIKVDFTQNGRLFQLGIWNDDHAGLPGTVLYMSDTFTTTPGTYILNVLPRVQVSGNFYVGIRQAGTTNVAFGFQYEIPIRPNVSYFTSPAGDTNWTPFSPGYDFNINIQPRLQVANDISVLEIITPARGDSILYSSNDSLIPKAKFINVGYSNQGAFKVKMEILNIFGQVVYTSDRFINLSAGDSIEVAFDPFSKYNIGTFTARATSLLGTDSVLDNNKLEVPFYMIKLHDISVDILFSPSAGEEFEMIYDSVFSTVRVTNYGSRKQTNVPVILEVRKGSTLHHTETRFVSLDAGDNLIFPFTPFNLSETGSYRLLIYSDLTQDSFRINDTVSTTLYVKKSYDLAVSEIVHPKTGSKFGLDAKFKPNVKVFNHGVKIQDDVLIVGHIYDYTGALIYSDSVIKQVFLLSTAQHLFKDFTCEELGTYTFECKAYIDSDQVASNDVMTSTFDVVVNHDLVIHSVVAPTGKISRNSEALSPLLVISNHGLKDATNVAMAMYIEDQTGGTVYQDTVYFNLAKNTRDTVSFTKKFQFQDNGDYYGKVFNLWDLEQFPNSQDSLSWNFIVRHTHDVSLDNHRHPKDQDTIGYLSDQYIAVQVTNFGLDTAEEVKIAIAVENASQEVLHVDTLNLEFLAYANSEIVYATRAWNAPFTGKMTLKSKVIGNDEDMTNQSQATVFYVFADQDLMASHSLGRKPGDSLLTDVHHLPAAVFKNNGKQDITQAIVRCKLIKNKVQIYNASQIIGLPAFDSMEVYFDSSLRSSDTGWAEIQFTVDHREDEVSSNDTLDIDVYFYHKIGSTRTADFSTVLVYPNPAESHLSIQAQERIVEVRIYDVTGRFLTKEKGQGHRHQLELTSLSSGTYILEVEMESTRLRKVIEKH